MTRKSSSAPLLRATAAARIFTAALVLAGLGGCMTQDPGAASRAPFSAASKGALGPRTPGATAQTSLIIADLAARRSGLPAHGPYAEVAQAVLEASKGTAQAQLRVARLTERAKSKNWLPQVGPQISLTSLGEVVTDLVFQQVLLDNGAKKAERDFAAADVEVAAVSLATEMNQTVHDGLKYYVNGLKARDQAAVSEASTAKLAEFDAIMRARVEGGLSDMSEARVLAQKLAEIEATAAADRDSAATADAQLAALAGRGFDGLRGLGAITLPEPPPEALSIKLAEGESARTVAEAKMERAEYLPGLTASAGFGSGKPDIGVTLGTGQLLGLGTKDTIAAIEATKEVAGREIEKERQDAALRLTALRSKLSALRAKEARDAGVVAQTGASLEMFTAQYKVGRRTLMELVNMYESYADMARDQAGLKYDIALIELEIAREYGILVDGSSI